MTVAILALADISRRMLRALNNGAGVNRQRDSYLIVALNAKYCGIFVRESGSVLLSHYINIFER